MAHGKGRRSHRSSGAAAGLTGPATASSLHSVDTHPPTRHESASIWKSPAGAPAELHLRAAHRATHAASDRHGHLR